MLSEWIRTRHRYGVMWCESPTAHSALQLLDYMWMREEMKRRVCIDIGRPVEDERDFKHLLSQVLMTPTEGGSDKGRLSQ
jgi:hypothetical protein